MHICSIGVLIRDEFGTAHSGVAKILPALSPLHAETLAMKEAHALTANLGITNIIFETDNLDLYSNCKNKDSHWKIHPVMKEIKRIKDGMNRVIYSWCKREANKATDEVARLCKSFKLPRLWISLPPETLFQKLNDDKKSLHRSR